MGSAAPGEACGGLRLRMAANEFPDCHRSALVRAVADMTRPIRIVVVPIALGLAFAWVSDPSARLSAQDQRAANSRFSPKRMADGKEWTTRNLNVNAAPSYCYEDAESNCDRYGRLYT